MSIRKPPAAARITVIVLVYAIALTMVLPFLWMVITSLKTDAEAMQPPTLTTLIPAQPVWENYARAVQEAELGRFYINSIVVAVLTTVLGVSYNALAGFAFAKMRFRGQKILFWMTLITMMLPVQVFFIFAYLISGRLGFVDNFQGLIIPFLASGFGIFYMRQVIAAVPDSLLEAGRIDGMNNMDLFWHIVRPNVWAAMTALAIFTFVNSWNSFFWPLVVVDSEQYKTLPLAVADLAAGLYVQSWPVQMAAATILVLPLIVLFFFLQRAFVRGVALTGVKE